jgi:hypothetical protein
MASAVLKGLNYEIHCSFVLKSLLNLPKLPLRSGQAGDKGIDLMACLDDYQVKVQCKAHSKAIGPVFIRYLAAFTKVTSLTNQKGIRRLLESFRNWHFHGISRLFICFKKVAVFFKFTPHWPGRQTSRLFRKKFIFFHWISAKIQDFNDRFVC